MTQGYTLPAGYRLTATTVGGAAHIWREDDPTVSDTITLASPASFGPYLVDTKFRVSGERPVDVTIARGALLGFGHVTYADGANEAEGDAETITADTRTIFSNDGAGDQTEERFMGDLPSNVWASNAHTLSGIGQSFDLLLEFKVKKTAVGTDALLTVTHDIGSDPLDTNSIIIFSRSIVLTKAQNVEQAVSMGWAAYGKETYLANGGRFYIECSENISVWGKEIFIRDGGIAPQRG